MDDVPTHRLQSRLAYRRDVVVDVHAVDHLVGYQWLDDAFIKYLGRILVVDCLSQGSHV